MKGNRKQIKHLKELPNNDFVNKLKEFHDKLNSVGYIWNNIIWNGKKRAFIVDGKEYLTGN